MKVYWPYCKKEVEYKIEKRELKEFRGIEVNTFENVAICNECNQDLYVNKIEDENNERIYKKKMEKIIVIGSPGAGKSSFSKKLKNITKLPLYHIDMLYHKKDGTHITKEELEEKLKEIFKTDKWIIDGNYQKTLELRINECDTIFLLDFPTQVCLEGAKSRIGQKRDDLPWLEEKLDENFKQCIINFTNEKLPQIYKLLDKYKMNHSIFIFKSRDEADNYIRNMEKKYANI